MKCNSGFAKRCFIYIICILGYIIPYAQSSFTKLIWQDEFNIPGKPDTSRWGYDTGNGCPAVCGWGNNELQYYTDRTENAIVEDGILKIKAKRENYNGAAFTSARLLSKGKFSVKYGRIEARVRVPEGVGTWPAFWMLGANIDKVGWPNCGEIDIMEHRGYELNKIFGTLHYPAHHGENANGKTLVVENAAKEFHVYTAEWTEEHISISVDGKLIHKVQNKKDIPFNHEFFILLNMAIGGGFAGPVDPAFSHATFEIDYVRVYQ